MKNIFIYSFISLFLFSCGGPSSKSLEIERQTLSCWSQSWSSQKGYDISEGMKLLDDYLFSKGYLGKRAIADYLKFAKDSNVIYISDTVENANKMEIALGSDQPVGPPIGAVVKCFEENWLNKMKELDSTDVLVRTGKVFARFKDEGNPDFVESSNDFFKDLTLDEFNRPLIKNLFYIFFDHQHVDWKIKFVHLSPANDPSGPPPPPPIPPPPPVPHLNSH